MSNLPRATNMLREPVVVAPPVVVAAPTGTGRGRRTPADDTHPVPAIGEHTNPAGERRTLIEAKQTKGRASDTRYTALTFIDHGKKTTLQGSPAEWARWAAKGSRG